MLMLLEGLKQLPDCPTEPWPPAERPPSGQHRLYYPFSSLPMVVDLLRNEKPVFLVWAGAAGSRLSTSPEPVGEGEER
jgi:hypothetical protein